MSVKPRRPGVTEDRTLLSKDARLQVVQLHCSLHEPLDFHKLSSTQSSLTPRPFRLSHHLAVNHFLLSQEDIS